MKTESLGLTSPASSGILGDLALSITHERLP
jgi:hypothetical protein